MLKNLSENLNLLMAKARMNSNELARKTGLPATTIKRIRNSDQANPTITTLWPIAKYFAITVDALLGEEPNYSMQPFMHGLNTIPLLTWRECIDIHALSYEKIPKKIATEKQVSEKSFALAVEEKDLVVFPEKSLLIVDPNKQPESGDYVIVAKSELGMASIKKYIIETDQVYLKSMITGLGIAPYTPEFKIVGVIVQYKMELTS